MDPCQMVQQIADHASPAGSAPAVCGSLASADTLLAVQTRCTGWRLLPGGAVQRQGTAGGAEPLTATAVFIFGLSPDSQ